MKNVEKSVNSVLAMQLGLQPNNIEPHLRLRQDLGTDSLDEVEILMALEEELEVAIPESEDVTVGLGTVQDLINLCRSKVSA